MSSEKPNTSNQTPPPDWKAEFDKQLHKVTERTQNFYNGHKNYFKLSNITAVIGGTLALSWLVSGVYIIDEGNRGVVTRFGAYTETTQPGPHWHLPTPFEKVTVVNVEQQRFIEIGYRDSNRFAKAALIPQESLMLTSDENIINVRLAVQYQINNAKDYLFNVKDNEATLKQLTESVERAVIGRNNMDFILTEGRSEIVAEIKKEIQLAMDKYQTGVTIASVNLQDAQPPEEVQGAFEDAIRAREDKQRLINEAEAYSNEIIPKARGAAARLIQEAEAYEAEKIAKSKGETERFDQLLVEYEKSPAITRKRLYLEAKERLYSGSNKILIESERNAAQFYMPVPAAVQTTSAPVTKASTEADLSADTSADKSGAHRAATASTDIRPSRSR